MIYILLSSLCIVSVFSSSLVPRKYDSVIQIGDPPVGPCPDFEVEIVVSDAHRSDVFATIMSEIQTEFVDVHFETLRLGPEELFQNNITVPALNALCDGSYRAFPYPMNVLWVRRWIRDSRQGQFALVREARVFDSFQDDFDVTVHVMSAKRPHLDFLANRMPSVGFVWTKMTKTRFRNTIMTTNVFGRLTMQHNHRVNDLLHTLLPPTIPWWLANSELGNEIMSGFAKHEVDIVFDGHLSPHWISLIKQYPLTAFIQYRTNETDRPNGSVWYYRRTVEYMLPSVGPEVSEWFASVTNGTMEPTRRPSLAPAVPHATLFDATGSNLWEWVRNREESMLYLYDDEPVVCNGDLDDVPNVGRMDVRVNDHELLPEHVQSGMILHFSNFGHRYVVRDCSSTLSDGVSKLEL